MNFAHRQSMLVRVVALTSVLIVLTTTGCSQFAWFAAKDTQDEQARESVLAAAREHRINMFGEMPAGESAPQYSRAVVSSRQHTFSEEGGDFDADINAIGTRMVFSSTRHNINPDLYTKSLDGYAVTQLTSDPGSDVQPEFSPDGRHVAFASDRSGNWDIWIIDIHGGQPIQVTNSPADEIHPSWSRDGEEIVYCSLPPMGGPWELWLAKTDTGASKKFIGYGLFPEWSPSEDVILYQRARERGSRWFSVWTLTLVDGEPRYPTEIAFSADHAMILPTWSPDGSRIAFASVAPGACQADLMDAPCCASDIWVVDRDGRSKIRLTDGYSANYAPVFALDGRIFYTTARSNQENVWSLVPTASLAGAGGSDTKKLTSTSVESVEVRETEASTVLAPGSEADGR